MSDDPEHVSPWMAALIGALLVAAIALLAPAFVLVPWMVLCH